jgi:hypothetical protein
MSYGFMRIQKLWVLTELRHIAPCRNLEPTGHPLFLVEASQQPRAFASEGLPAEWMAPNVSSSPKGLLRKRRATAYCNFAMVGERLSHGTDNPLAWPVRSPARKNKRPS